MRSMAGAGAIHTLDLLTVASWALAGKAIITVGAAITVNIFAAAHREKQESRLSVLVRLARLPISHLRSLSRITTSHPGRRTAKKTNHRPQTSSLVRRYGLIFPAAVMAAIMVIGVAVGARIFAPGSSTFSAVQAIEAVPGSHTMALLEAERAQLIGMTTAARTLTVVAKPELASPAQVAASNPGTRTGSGTGIVYVTSTPPNPSTAQSIAHSMMANFGFSPQTFGCLVDLWNRTSGWMYDAENVSGAYGIPQALPGSRMASAGLDWQTNPTTQIRWGLSYIKGTYGNPCNAWAFEEANGYY